MHFIAGILIVAVVMIVAGGAIIAGIAWLAKTFLGIHPSTRDE